MGASTCAFGSHKWKPYIGILMVNARRQNSHHIEVNGRESLDIFVLRLMVGMDSEAEKEYMVNNAIRRGRDPARV